MSTRLKNAHMQGKQLQLDGLWNEDRQTIGPSPIQILRTETNPYITSYEPEEEQRFYAEHGNAEARRRLASLSQNLEVLAFLAKNDDDPEVLDGVMERVITGNVHDKDDAISENLIKNVHATFRIHDTFSKDKRPGIRMLVAAVTSYARVLEKLSHDRDYLVLECVADNEHTKLDTLKRLGNHADSNVRWAVANCLRAPEKTLQKLRSDEDESVRKSANSTLQKLAEKEIATNFGMRR